MAPTVQCLLGCFDLPIKLLLFYKQGILKSSSNTEGNTESVSSIFFPIPYFYLKVLIWFSSFQHFKG